MRIGQILLEGAPFYERKSQAIDARLLALHHQVTSSPEEAEVLHLYGPPEFPAERLRGVTVPYVANGRPTPSLFPWRNAPSPSRQALPFGSDPIPEAVDDAFFAQRRTAAGDRGARRVGSVRRGREIAAMHTATSSRIVRYRDDVEWKLFDRLPTPPELAALDLWVDPAVEEHDLDGGVAEAMVIGVPVVASRTSVNRQRLADGRSGILVPPRDPNELTHAMLNALFKPEENENRLDDAYRTRDRFRPEQRAIRLVQIYESLLK